MIIPAANHVPLKPNHNNSPQLSSLVFIDAVLQDWQALTHISVSWRIKNTLMVLVFVWKISMEECTKGNKAGEDMLIAVTLHVTQKQVNLLVSY